MAADQPSAADVIRRLEDDIARVRADPGCSPRTAKLLASGRGKMAKKLAEEAVEVALDAVRGDRKAVVAETADLLYNLFVLLNALGIASDDVWREMERRRGLLGIAEKLPKAPSAKGD